MQVLHDIFESIGSQILVQNIQRCAVFNLFNIMLNPIESASRIDGQLRTLIRLKLFVELTITKG